ncbi:hypothetical protein MC885_003821 [Smutsia gigantea]|nr:hypothetical protein MC885_003821 [Smutsia gigantea]
MVVTHMIVTVSEEEKKDMNLEEEDTLISVAYDIFEKMLGVFIYKHTQAEGKKLGSVGWVQSTDQSPV